MTHHTERQEDTKKRSDMQTEAIRAALASGSLPPKCLNCDEPLKHVGQLVEATRYWLWDETNGGYSVGYYEHVELPECRNCENADAGYFVPEVFTEMEHPAYAD